MNVVPASSAFPTPLEDAKDKDPNIASTPAASQWLGKKVCLILAGVCALGFATLAFENHDETPRAALVQESSFKGLAPVVSIVPSIAITSGSTRPTRTDAPVLRHERVFSPSPLSLTGPSGSSGLTGLDTQGAALAEKGLKDEFLLAIENAKASPMTPASSALEAQATQAPTSEGANLRAPRMAPHNTAAVQVVSEDARELFNWAERTFPHFFPTSERDLIAGEFEFRYYPSTGNYLAVYAQRVYTLGPMNNGLMVDHGTLLSFACSYKPDRCATAPVATNPSNTGIVTSVPTPSYPAGSDALIAFEMLNRERSRCGFGMQRQNALLDRSAQGHVGYLALNAGLSNPTHTQTVGRPGFTGATAADRARAAGYGSGVRADLTQVGENFNMLYHNQPLMGKGFTSLLIQNLLNAPYHTRGMMGNQKEVGLFYGPIAQVRESATSTRYEAAIVLNHGVADSSVASNFQRPSATMIRTYPCDGATGIQKELRFEMPNPTPGRDLQTNPIGSSIYIASASEQSILRITNATVQNRTTGTFSALLPVMTRSNDPNRMLGTNEAFIIPNAPMQAMTAYSVVIDGTNDGVAFTRRFTFTTGADAF